MTIKNGKSFFLLRYSFWCKTLTYFFIYLGPICDPFNCLDEVSCNYKSRSQMGSRRRILRSREILMSNIWKHEQLMCVCAESHSHTCTQTNGGMCGHMCRETMLQGHWLMWTSVGAFLSESIELKWVNCLCSAVTRFLFFYYLINNKSLII